MKPEGLPRFDRYTLKEIAGDRVFKRGEAYFAEGMVHVLSIEPGRILARVTGSENYRTVVSGQKTTEIGGECSCPAFAREGFCKHMVAVALAANASDTTETTASSVVGEDNTMDRIRTYLRSKGVDALVDMIVDIAEWEPALLQKLEIAAAVVGADDKELELQVRSAIRNATHTRGFIDYRHAPNWAAGVDAALDLLAGIESGPRGALLVKLADYAIDRIEAAIENIDDSDGHCGSLLARAQEFHLKACKAAKPDPAPLARDLFRREMEGAYDTFQAAAVDYADVLGDEGLAEYRRLAQEAWDELPTRVGPARGSDDFRFDYYQLLSTLDFFAERDGNTDLRVALRAKDLSSSWDYLRLVEFCHQHGREEEALRRAEEGIWLFEDEEPDERLIFAAVDLLLTAGRTADAEAHLWRAFEKTPGMPLYARLRALGGEAAKRRAMDRLRQGLTRGASSRWYSPADLLVLVMIEEKMFDAAWDTVRDYGASRPVREKLVVASEVTHVSEALTFYAERVEDLARTGGNPAYEEAAALVARMGALRGEEEHDAYLAALRERHKRKRNFMKVLAEPRNASFGH